MKEKPPVLSIKQIDDVWPDEVAFETFTLKNLERELLLCGRVVAEAQRDADVAYYEPIIQQAKAEVAREIFDCLSDKFQLEKKHIVPCSWDKLSIRRDDLQSLKDKWLKEEK